MEEQEDFYLTWRTNKLASLRYNCAICMLAAGYSPNEVAEHLGVTVRAVQMWFKEGDFNDSLRYAIHITFQSAQDLRNCHKRWRSYACDSCVSPEPAGKTS